MGDVSAVNGIGFAAAGLVLATFCMRSMSALRWVAIASNAAFITYAYLAGLPPVLLLHVLLLPINICRLMQLRGGRSDSIVIPRRTGPPRNDTLRVIASEAKQSRFTCA